MRIKPILAIALLAIVSTLVFAASYYFPISSAGSEYVNVTMENDSSAEWDGANRIARAYINYISIWSQLKIALGISTDEVYISYADGTIAKFIVVDPGATTIRLRFIKAVPSLPPGTRNAPSNVDGVNQNKVGVSSRLDRLDQSGQSILIEVYAKSGSVEVIQYIEAGTGSCMRCEHWVELN